MRSSLVQAVVLASFAVPASAELVVDQVGAQLRSGGYTTFAAQSFKPGLDNIAAIEFSVYVNSGTNQATVTLFSDYNGSVFSGELASTVVTYSESDNLLLATWDAVSVTVDETYYFKIDVTGGAISSARGTIADYDRGAVVAGGGNTSDADLVFRTFAVPAPGSFALAGIAGLVASRRRRR